MAAERDGFPPFSNARYYRLLSLLGSRNQLFVYVFSPRRIDWIGRQVDGCVYNRSTGQWEWRRLPFPDLVYDRFFYSPGRRAALDLHQARLLRNRFRGRFLGIGLPDKCRVYRMLAADAALRPHLPDLRAVSAPGEIRALLAKYGDVVVKPRGGSQGKGIFRLTALDEGPVRFRAAGRTLQNGTFRRAFRDPGELDAWLAKHLVRCRAAAMPYLRLTTRSGRPFDIRAFVQKDRTGRWVWIGMAARVGEPGQLTSNLHGGGQAVDARELLRAEFGGRAAGMAEQLRSLSLRIARVLQARHGPLVELGIDFGIEPAGAVWILEANSRPGRSIFGKTGNRAASRRSICNPIHYACYLRDRLLGG